MSIQPKLKPQPGLLFLGVSEGTNRIRCFAEKVADSDHSVLLRGETGVGKDLLAKLIHQLGRMARPFVMVDCGTLPPTLSQTELFGYEPGAFTDARRTKLGLIQQAGEGTLFFNELANMGSEVQAVFLGILDGNSFRPVGSEREEPMRARIIGATNADLERRVKENSFRLDLYHRLRRLTFRIPTLRERREDIPEFVNHYLKEESGVSEFSSEAMVVMTQYSWPGNVRELIDVVAMGALNARLAGRRTIQVEDISSSLNGVGESVFPTYLQVQRRYLRDVLRSCHGRLNEAAAIADVNKVKLNQLIQEFQLQDFVAQVRGEDS